MFYFYIFFGVIVDEFILGCGIVVKFLLVNVFVFVVLWNLYLVVLSFFVIVLGSVVNLCWKWLFILYLYLYLLILLVFVFNLNLLWKFWKYFVLNLVVFLFLFGILFLIF